MSVGEIVALIVGIVGCLTGAGSFIISAKRAKNENRGLDADASAKYLKLASDAGEELVVVKQEYDKKIAEMEGKIAELQKRLASQEKELKEVKTELELYRDHNEKLSHQVYSLGGTPVPMVVKAK